MIPLKYLKIVDFAVQLLAGILPVIYYLCTAPNGTDTFPSLLNIYYVLGGAQALSCVANRLYLPKEHRANLRGWYELSLFLLLAMAGISFFMEALMLVLIILIYLSPVLALVYFGITIAELVHSINKPTEI